jgi:cytochrome c-type biogenesis protein CcmH
VTLLLLLAMAFAEGPTAGALAPEATEAERGIGVGPFGDPPTSEAEVVDRSMALSHRLRCPVCQGLSVADSSAPASEDIKARVMELVRLGYTDDQINDYFVDRYGTWILLAPPAADHELLWFLPLGAAVTAIGVLAWWVSRRQPAPPLAGPSVPGPDDSYRRRILEEIGE